MLCRWVHKDIVCMNSCVNFKRDGEGVQLSEKSSRKKICQSGVWSADPPA